MFLKVEIEGSETIYYSMTKSVINIGQLATNNIIINVNSISRNHVRFICEGNNWYAMDLESTNGTYFKNNFLYPNEKQAIKPNEFVKLGDQVFITLVSSAEDPRPLSNAKVKSGEVEDLQDKTRVVSLKEMREKADIDKRIKKLKAEQINRDKKPFNFKRLAIISASFICIIILMSFYVSNT